MASASAAAPAPALENLTSLKDAEAFPAWLLSDVASLHVLFCFTDWHEPSKAGGAMDTVFRVLAERHPAVEFASADVDAIPSIAEELELSVVPSFFFFKNKVLLDRLEGADAAELTSRVDKLQKPTDPAVLAAGAAVKPLDELTKRLQRLVSASPVMIFMKGSPEAPKCKYSRQAVDLLNEAGIGFGSFDILSSPAVRQGLKDMSDWPTYPQIYAHGKLVGGVDILLELKDSGELATVLPKAQALAPAATETAAPAAAAAAVTAAAEPGPYTGLTPALTERLRALTSRSPVVLFMKGSPDAPRCGFSDRIVRLLREHGVQSFDSFDILGDQQVREGLKVLFNWPTFPQLYVHGALVGGLDVLNEMIDDSPDEPLPKQLGL